MHTSDWKLKDISPTQSHSFWKMDFIDLAPLKRASMSCKWSSTASLWNRVSARDNLCGAPLALNSFVCTFTLKLTFYIAGSLEPPYCLPFIPPSSCIHALRPACTALPVPHLHAPRHAWWRSALYWVHSSSFTHSCSWHILNAGLGFVMGPANLQLR